MPKFNYVALDSHGKETRGTLEVNSHNEALARVKEIGLFPTKIVERGHDTRPQSSTVLKSIGYWKNEREARHYPRPQWFVQHGWHAEESHRILAYLRSGYEHHSELGYSSCRFEDCTDECARNNGVSTFTDGEWAWPQGLAHYIDKHSVILPEEFVSTMRSNQWQVPERPVISQPVQQWPVRQLGRRIQQPISDRFWIRWARKHGPWHYRLIFW